MGNMKAKYETLKEKLGPEKRITKLVSVRKPYQLGFVDLLVYSTLIFRVKQSGCSARQVALMTGLHQSVTIPKVLQRLVGFGLIVKTEKLWSAVSPPSGIADWFVLMKAEQLKNRFRYNWIGVPAADSPLTNIQAAIVACLVLKMPQASIARFLRVSLKSVGRVAKMLKANGNKFVRAWFQDVGVVEKKKTAKDTVKAEAPKVVSLAGTMGITDDYLAKQLDRNCRLMAIAGMDQKQQDKFWPQVVSKFSDPNGDQCEGMLFSFGTRLGTIQADHNHNKKAGKADAETCYFLLCHEYGVKP